VGARAAVFVPITFALTDLPEPHTNRGMHWVHLFARLAPGVTPAQVAAAITGPYRAILSDVELPLWEARPQEVLNEFAARSILLEPGARGQSTLLVPLRGRLEWLLAASGALLLLCCANVVGLLLIRGAARGGEMAVRASMGATRGRLAALLLAESALLAVPAAAASLPIGVLILAGLASGVPGLPPAAFDVTLSVGAAAAAVIVAVVTALAAGLFPLRTLAGARAVNVLQAYGGRQTPAKAPARFRTALATSQIALAMALLAITGVCAHSLANIARIDLGIAADSLITFSLPTGTSGYTPEASANLALRLDEELAAIPGVSSVASSSFPLLSGEEPGTYLRRVDDAPLDDGLVSWNVVGPGFFRTVGIELLAGREFVAADTGRGLTVVIVNRSFAERYGVGVGSTVGFTPRGDRHEIVGIVADAKYGTVTGDVKPLLYNAASGRGAEGTYFVRGARSPEDLLATVRDTVKRLAPDVPIADLRTMEQQVAENTGAQRFLAAASTAFAVLATALAALGLYGVLAYSVAQRAREIALRVALGAPASRVRGAVLRQVAVMATAGVALGLAAAVLLGRAARSVLFGVESWDPIALTGAAAVLALAVLGAAYVPARRASRVDPMAVLRYE
ncbi:MAG TPA: FtsX-like permease family protein, partial [Gammaproteobacteria bacterium]|nr:FtsX-like permease family protein [Gammaproteobacteria bacterium]